MTVIYKILPRQLWQDATVAGVFQGSGIDLADGYIHFSDASQAEETARRHFHGQTDLLLVAFDSDVLGQDLRWEASRGGALFPHLYATLNPAAALWARPLPWDGALHRFPEGWKA